MARVLVTYGWVRSSYAVVRSYGRRGETVYVGYSDPLSMAVYSRYCHTGVRLPDFFSDPLKYVDSVAVACRKHAIDVLVPGHEDLYWLARYRDRLPGDTILVHAPVKSLELAGDKACVLECARDVNCPVPDTVQFSSPEALDRLAENHDYPAVLKTRTGNSAKGVAICRNSEQLKSTARRWIDQYNLGPDQYPIIQDYLPGPAIGTCHLFKNGNPVAAFSERYLRAKDGTTFGTSTLRCQYDAPEAVAAGNRLLKSLNWNGVAHLDFMADANGCFRLIEANPRFWGALQLSIGAGINFPDLLLDMALNRKMPAHNPYKKGITYRWLLGDGITLLNLLAKGQFRAAVDVLAPTGPGGFDDFFRDDPIPFFFELMCYGWRFLSSGSANPISHGMIQGEG